MAGASAVDVAQRLASHFPALFSAGAPRPLKLRIQADIQQRAPGEFTRKALSAFLHRHTTSTAYLKALLASPTRFDLDGQPSGEIAPEHRDAATAELARRRAVVQARRAAARGAPRPAHAAAAALADAAAMPAAADGATAAAPTGDMPVRIVAPRHRDGRDAGRGAGPGARPGARHEPRERGPRGVAAGRPGHGVQNVPGATRDGAAGQRRAERSDPHGHEGRPARTEGGERAASAGRSDRAASAAQPTRPMPDVRRQPRAARPADAPADAPMPADEAQRERALLLRAWESSPLAKANFCALKRLSEADFDAQIAQARVEREARR
ncbi:MAG: ProQ/FinO family protein [Burkholderiales bacterium]|nr:ProQ/FinO family protein [Burkholderiales bacterium]